MNSDGLMLRLALNQNSVVLDGWNIRLRGYGRSDRRNPIPSSDDLGGLVGPAGARW